jgi:non-ribosomal peptide synthetase component F
MFLLQNTPAQPLEAPGAGLTLTPVESQAQIATFDLTLVLHDAEDRRGGLAGWLWYNRDLLDAGSVAVLGERFRLLLESAVADPGRRLSELSLVTEEERHQLLAGPRPRFERRAGQDPETVAMIEAGILAIPPEHAAVLDRLAEDQGIDERDLWMGPAPLADWGTFLYGGRLVLPEEPAATPEALAVLVQRERVTVLILSPALFEALAAWVAAAPRRDAGLRSLRWVLVEGEADSEAVRDWRARFGDRRARLVQQLAR